MQMEYRFLKKMGILRVKGKQGKRDSKSWSRATQEHRLQRWDLWYSADPISLTAALKDIFDICVAIFPYQNLSIFHGTFWRKTHDSISHKEITVPLPIISAYTLEILPSGFSERNWSVITHSIK